MEMDEVKTIHGIHKLIPNLEEMDLKPSRVLQQKRESSPDLVNQKRPSLGDSAPQTPPRPHRQSLSLSEYSKMEKKNHYLPHKSSQLQEKEVQRFSFKDIQLPKIENVKVPVFELYHV